MCTPPAYRPGVCVEQLCCSIHTHSNIYVHTLPSMHKIDMYFMLMHDDSYTLLMTSEIRIIRTVLILLSQLQRNVYKTTSEIRTPL